VSRPAASNRPALLDINVLIALFDPDHVHHETAHDWFADHRDDGWATCPLTENGFIRVLSHAALGDAAQRPAALRDRLSKFCKSGQHVFWPDAVSLRDRAVFSEAFVAGPRQLTDVYLLGLAVKMKGALATFDRSIPLSAVVGATGDTLRVISASAL
jgi:toxin-antitoxin system PIN domain toxin